MLIKFTVENFLSFMDKSSLNMEAGSIREFNKNVFSSKIGTLETRLLKSVFLSGGNSKGKSNFLKAFLTMKNMVIYSGGNQQLYPAGTIIPFLLNTKTANAPTTFEVTFLIERTCYRYGFIADSQKVHIEWLYTTQKRKEENVFIRTGKNVDIDKRFSPEQKQKLKFALEMTRADALFLSVLSQFDIDFALRILKWYQENTLYLDNELDSRNGENTVSYTASLLKHREFKKLIYEILEKADLGFYSLEDELNDQLSKKPSSSILLNALYNESTAKYTIKTKHKVYNEQFQAVDDIYFDLLKQESAGTKKFIGMLGPISKTILEGKIMWIDELDAQLHTMLMGLLLKLFHNSPHNIYGAQFIITTHNSHVLKKLRRDQMIMLDKDQYGASTIGSVYNTKPNVRSDVIFDKEYLSGSLGGIPKIGQMSLFDKEDDF